MIFISSALQQPRHQKRMRIFCSNFDCSIWYFERGGYKLNYKGWDKRAICISKIKNKNYLLRLMPLLKLYIKLCFTKDNKVYCTSLDQALVSVLARKKVVMELGDLQQLSGPGFMGFMVKYLDRWLVKKINGVVLTSPFYFSAYYASFQGIDRNKFLIVENKVPLSIEADVNNQRNADYEENNLYAKIKLGVIGSISDRAALQTLISIVKRRDDMELHIFGDGDLQVFEGLSNCMIHGAFRSPEDLCEIYGKIDVNFIVYDANDDNVKIALPNKLYESIAFGKPIICAKGVALAEIVESKRIGVACEIDEIEYSLDLIMDNYREYIDKIFLLSKDEYLDNSESELVKFVENKLGT